jgi:hypothetical protein
MGVTDAGGVNILLSCSHILMQNCSQIVRHGLTFIKKPLRPSWLKYVLRVVSKPHGAVVAERKERSRHRQASIAPIKASLIEGPGKTPY